MRTLSAIEVKKRIKNNSKIHLVNTLNENAFLKGHIPKSLNITSMKVVIKGIVTAEDANSALQNGADALIVSNRTCRVENR